MGLRDWFAGKPKPDAYARQLIQALRDAGDPREIQFDAEEFRLVMGNSGIVNLRNLYLEYCRVPKSQRSTCLREQVRGALSYLKQLPEEFEDAKSDLRPRLWPRSYLENVRLQQRLKGEKAPAIPSQHFTENLEVVLVYDFPESVRSIGQNDLDVWQVTFYEALEIARDNLAASECSLGTLGNSLYTLVTGDTYDSSRLMLLDMIRAWPVKGEPIAMVPNRDTLLVTGSEDLEGLGLMLAFAETDLEEDPRPMVPSLFRLSGDQWGEWQLTPGHPHFKQAHALAVKWCYQEYAKQKQALDAIFEAELEDVFVASYLAMQDNETGELGSFCAWSKGIPSLLPLTDTIALLQSHEGEPLMAPWERVVDVVGHLMEETDHFPPRFRVNSFPSDSELQRIGGGK